MAIIFVFGSNIQGIHGAGAALEAKQKWGAVQGVGCGFTGNSFAIPTKYGPYTKYKFEVVKRYIEKAIVDIGSKPENEYWFTQIGCGFAGFTKEQIAPLFKEFANNRKYITYWPKDWHEILFGEVSISRVSFNI
jgi:hypothetical protein